MRHNHNSRAIAAALLVASITGAALADGENVTIKFEGVGYGGSMQISTNGGSTFTNVFGGTLRMLSNGNVAFQGFCVDPFTHMSSNTTQASKLGTDAMEKNGLRVGYLVNKYLPQILSEGDSGVRADKSLALQSVLWELVADNGSGNNLATGSFRARGAGGEAFTAQQLSFINQFMGDQGQGVAAYYKAALNQSCNPVSQAVVTAVPEPATIGAVSIGIAAFLRRRKKK